MIIKNGFCFNENNFEARDILIENEKIIKLDKEMFTPIDVNVIEATGMYVVPGFIDIHTHGANGVDIMDAGIEELEKLSAFYASKGVVGFLPTVMTASEDEIIATLRKIKFLAEAQLSGCMASNGAKILGINLEGPFISREFKGVHREEMITKASVEKLEMFYEESGGLIKLVTVAPEFLEDESLINFAMSKGIRLAAGHTGLKYSESIDFFHKGITHITHLFNAMRSMHHREVGLVGAALCDESVTVELIADGIHVCEGMIKILLKCKNANSIALVTDSTMATGLEDGEYTLGGERIIVKSGEARVEDGTIAGSTLTIDQAVRNMIGYGMTLHNAVRMASVVPGRVIGVDSEMIEGGIANLTIIDGGYNVRATIINGKVVYMV